MAHPSEIRHAIDRALYAQGLRNTTDYSATYDPKVQVFTVTGTDAHMGSFRFEVDASRGVQAAVRAVHDGLEA